MVYEFLNEVVGSLLTSTDHSILCALNGTKTAKYSPDDQKRIHHLLTFFAI